jgi:UDP-N-acetylmuramoyl-L-alanyl-D-glutamate--2,6-diaminopimelate ligase
MDLGELTADEALAGTEISDLSYSSRDVTEGGLFFCVPGFAVDGHEYAPDAVNNGAAALVCERPLELGVPEFVVDDVRAAMPLLARRFFGDPSAELDVIGITGTNGKTTIGYLVRQILEGVGRPCGLLGTVAWIIAGRETPAERTTPEAIDLARALRAMADSGEQACAIEVSSHALELGRVDEVAFSAAVFTNLTQDHLDFHETMEDYFEAKRVLFASSPGFSIVNLDDHWGRRLSEEFDCVTYSAQGREGADFIARDVEFDATGSRFTVVCTDPQIELPAKVALPGLFNVANALAALATVITLGTEPLAATQALAGASGAPGRFEPVVAGQDFGVFVDYAHTPDSIENVLLAARELPHERVISIVGAGGDRDRTKRPLMGAAAAAGSDVVYVTSDNPRSEDPAAIIDEVLVGARSAAETSGARVEYEIDRRSAIEQATAEARAGDIVFVFGKGHEQGQEFAGGRKIPFDDATVVRESLAGRTAPAS